MANTHASTQLDRMTKRQKRQDCNDDENDDYGNEFDKSVHLEKIIQIMNGKTPNDRGMLLRKEHMVRLSYYMVFSTCSQITSSIDQPIAFYAIIHSNGIETTAYSKAMLNTTLLIDGLLSPLRITKHKLKLLETGALDACTALCNRLL
jgi:hypothetical protein